MGHSYVPAVDSIPGIMPGTIKVPPPPEFNDEEYPPSPCMDETYAKKMAKLPKRQRQNPVDQKRRMMPCDQD